MTGIENKSICLSLNAGWAPCGYKTVKEAIVQLCGGENAALAMDIQHEIDNNGMPNFDVMPSSCRPVSWEEWITLPIRPWDLTISSQRLTIRVPTVIISVNYTKMPVRRFKGKPSKEAIWNRDGGVCQYTGKKLTKGQANIDHVVPSSRGGRDTWTNMVLSDKIINQKKGNKLNSEAGLTLLKEPVAPSPMPMYQLITEAKHADWNFFLKKK